MGFWAASTQTRALMRIPCLSGVCNGLKGLGASSSRHLSVTAAHQIPSVKSGIGATKKSALDAGRGSSLLAFYCDHHVVPLPEGHRFPMDKYRSTRLMLEEDASLQHILLTRAAPAVSEEELFLVHDRGYVNRILSGEIDQKEQRALGFPWSAELVQRCLSSVGGTVGAMHAVMMGFRRAAANIAGGTHHAFSSHGEGFCVFNDIAVAAATALEHYSEQCNLTTPILVIDLDVHQGNGTAKIFENNRSVITFSMHGANNYPWRTKMKSDYDVDLADNTSDSEYLKVLAGWLPLIFDRHQPGFVFFQAGVDALEEDSFGRLAMTRQGLLKRNNMVYSECLKRNVPLVITMGGGYSLPTEASVLAHADVYRSAALRYESHNASGWRLERGIY